MRRVTVESSLSVLNTLKWLSPFGGHLRQVGWAMTWVDSPMECIIRPIRSAISPETPVSISVEYYGRLFQPCAGISLRLSISRDISPPDAAFSSGIRSWFLLNRYRKATLSIP